MKRVVWKNKSNNQLCVTIPKETQIREGEIVEIQKSAIKKIAYSGVVGDLFHYGHLQSLQYAKSIADYNIAGVFTDEVTQEYRAKPVCNLQERKAVFQSLTCVDRVMVQQSRDPTENLKKIHEEFPDAEIILVHGDDLTHVHGSEYVTKIGGKVAKHPYYPRLSNFKIIQYLSEQKNQFKDITPFTFYIQNKSSWDMEAMQGNKVIISSKADTLKALQPLLTKSHIERLEIFTISEWKNDKEKILAAIQHTFAPNLIVVRSSAVSEDTLEKSMAGYFTSVLQVSTMDTQMIEAAIKKVLLSYKEKNAETSFNQVLVQQQTTDIMMSGVIFTRTLEKNAPYYVINYDDHTGSTESVTSGREHKTVVISHFTSHLLASMQPIVDAVREIEQLIPKIPLDIEFALTQKGEVVIFQVRPLAANLHKETYDAAIQEKINGLKTQYAALAAPLPHLAGETTYFGDMPDWNPAEIIGDRPNLLDYSLYDYLITNSAWHEARTSQHYYNVSPAKLVELFGNKPYVNVRHTFNSFTPAAISPALRKKLVAFYLKKLRQTPHLQDKVEFEILYTCYDLTFAQRSAELREAGFSDLEIDELRQALLNLTNSLLMSSTKHIADDMNAVTSLEEFRAIIQRKVQAEHHTHKELINYSKVLLDECRKKGTVQFSRLARLGFIGKTILKSIVHEGLITQNHYDQFYNSISTIATTISEDFKKLLKGEWTKEQFIAQYYHLRPGTYDITSLRYDLNPQLLQTATLSFQQDAKESFQLDSTTIEQITKAYQEAGLQCTANEFFSFVEKATQARELSKFEFTKNVSEALELLAKAGEEMGFTRKEIALLNINDIFRINAAVGEVAETIEQWKSLIKQQEKERQIDEKLVLPALLFSQQDLEIIEHYQAKPNYITQKTVESRTVNIHELHDHLIPDLEGSIVVLENGDPGYDWIFTRNIAGLITKYGGIASHMSIRCAEFGIPAAIGCGEAIFNKVKDTPKVLLDCKNNKIVPFH